MGFWASTCKNCDADGIDKLRIVGKKVLFLLDGDDGDLPRFARSFWFHDLVELVDDEDI